MYAIIKTGGKQYRVSEGDVLNIEKLDVEAGSEVVFNEVLTVVADSDVKIGKPVVDGAKVTAKVVEHGRLRRFLFLNIKQNPTTANAKVIVNRSLKLKSLKSKLNSNDYSRFI